MTNYNKSADVVAMDINAPEHMVSFGKKGGCYISRTVGWLLVITFVSAVAATGLLVYFYAPRHKIETPVEGYQNSRVTPVRTTVATTTTTTTTAASTTTTAASTTTTAAPTTSTSMTTTSATITTNSPVIITTSDARTTIIAASTTTEDASATTASAVSTTVTAASATTTEDASATTASAVSITDTTASATSTEDASATTEDASATTIEDASATTTDDTTTTTASISTTSSQASTTASEAITTTFQTSTTASAVSTTDTAPSSTAGGILTTITTTVPSIIATPEKEKIDARLPRALKPLHYLVKLQPFINGNFSILGYVEVEMEVLEPTLNITLHIADIITKNDTITLRDKEDKDGFDLVIKKHEYDPKREFYLAHLEEALQQGHKYVLSMEFTGLLNDKLHGFYRSSYRDAQGKEKWLAVTQFQATDARRAFPCFDEPALKAKFEVHLAREENMTSISNMPINSTFPVEGQEGWVWDHYQTTVPMSTYLVAFVVSDFAYLNSTDIDSTLFRVWAREEAVQQAEYAMNIGPAILTHFEDYFNQSYPLPKQDMIAIPDFAAGAMENWGLITYRETAMLFDPELSAPTDQYRVALVVAHELAHQWFGNLVTPRWWTDIWLNEGFAAFVQYIGMDYVEPTWKVKELFVADKLQNVFTMDSLESSHQISIPVGHPNEIGQIFDSISYDKGASIIRMMNHFLTEDTLRKGLSKYLNDFKYGNAEQDDLWEHLTEAAHQDGTLPLHLTVKTIMDTWTLQMGYPVIMVDRSQDGTSATVSQERFLMAGKADSKDAHVYKWWVPLTYTGGDDPNFNNTQVKVWMKESETHITIPSLPNKDHWVIFNLRETGYYRVNYDHNNWNLLIQQLLTDHRAIHTVNRAQIIDDVMDLARAGHVSYDVALELYSYLRHETEYVPWVAAVNNLGYLRSMFTRTGSYGALKSYLLDMVVPLYDRVGFDNRADDPLLEQYLRHTAVSWACTLSHKPCQNNALSLFRQWMTNPKNHTIISPNLKPVIYCQALAAGGEEEWNFSWDQYLQSNVGSEKNRLLSAMGCTRELWLLSRYLEMAFDSNSGIRKQDTQLVFAAVAYNDVGRPLAWTFLRDNWKKVYDYFGGKAKSFLISSSASGFNTRQQLKEVMAFQEEHREELKTASRKVDQKIETITNDIAWMDANYETIVQWLEQHGYSTKLRSI